MRRTENCPLTYLEPPLDFGGIKMRKIFMTIMIMILLSVTAFGADRGFITEPENNPNEAYDVYEISPITKEIVKKRAVVFDVYEDGTFAIGCEDYNRKYVYVYSAKKEFLYGYSFSCSGSFEIELLADSINIYMVRGDKLVNLGSNGEVLSYEKILDLDENWSYWNEVRKTEKKVDDKTYSLKDRALLIFPSYAKLVVTDSEGNEEILYEGKDFSNKDKFALIAGIIVIINIFRVLIPHLKKIIKEKPSKEAPAHLPPPPMVNDSKGNQDKSQSVDDSEIGSD